MAASKDPKREEATDPIEAAPVEDLEEAEESSLELELGEGEAEEEAHLDLDVEVDERSACERHITVRIPREEIDRYFDKEFTEMMPTAQVPGFRPGRAPRKLVEARFRKEAAERVKGALLVDCIEQVNEEKALSAIGEPDFDLDKVELPDEGPMTFEFDLEVRPQFDLPPWKGLRIERPVRDFTDADVEAAMKNALAEHGRLAPWDGPAELGDYIATNLTFKYGDQVLSSAEEEVIRIRPVLSFRDGKIQGFDQVMAGVRAGETRQAEAVLSPDAPNVELRGATITAVFDVQEVKRLQLPEMTPEFLDDVGGFESEAELRDAVREDLQRRLEYQQHRRAREQITQALTATADWELPPHLLERQSKRELERAILELQRSGFTQDEIRAFANELRQNSTAATARALKEHFILERLAEEEEIEETPEDYEQEIRLIARQSGQSARRVRARLEKSGRMDVLRNQIIERKAIDLILDHAQIAEVPYEPEEILGAEALDRTAAGGEEPEIPDAKPEGHAAKARETPLPPTAGPPESPTPDPEIAPGDTAQP